MPRSIPCPACSARLTLPDQLPDHVKSVRCPKCKKSMSVVKKPTTVVKKAAISAPRPVAEAPSPHPAAAVFSTPQNDTVHAAAADTQTHGLLPDLDDVGLAADPNEPIPLAPQPVTPLAPPTIEPLDDLVPVQAADDDLVPVEAAAGADELVEVEAAVDDLVSVEAADAEVLDDLEMVDEEPEVEEVDDIEEVDDRREPLPGMLGYDEFLIRPQSGLGNLYYEIQDFDRKKPLGAAKEERGVAGMLFGRKAANLAIYDDLRERLLCTLHRPMSLFKSRVEIFDHKERALGTIAFRMVQFLGGTIYDWDGREWATITGKWGAAPAMHIKDDRGHRLGKFTLETFQTKKVVFKIFTKGMSWYVKVGKRLRYDADGKLLLLASAVAYDMVRISMDGSGITMG